mgnify:CR=1 FL=1
MESACAYLLTALMGYMSADLTWMYFRDQLIPTKAPPMGAPRFAPFVPGLDRNTFDLITRHNFFNADGKIADPFGAPDAPVEQKDGPPMPTQLPLALVGTLVHANGNRSVATINLKSKNMNQSYPSGAEIEGMAKIIKIERNMVTFRNLSSRRLEFIEIRNDAKLTLASGTSAPRMDEEVFAESDTHFSIKRTDLDKYLNDLPNILQTATAVPHIGPTGRVEGWKLVNIQKESIFNKLGLKMNDIIKNVNGEEIDSPARAMELFQAMRGSASIRMDIDRADGRKETLDYTIK